jgi:hypothetical protein
VNLRYPFFRFCACGASFLLVGSLASQIAAAQSKHKPDAKTDLSGVWSPEPVLSIRPKATALLLRREAAPVKPDPDSRCTLPGVPRIDFEKPFKILQSPDEVVILYEDYTTYRQIFTDGRALPEDPQPSWLGYSVGKWDGDTLVVDSTGFNDESWLDSSGTTHSEALHVTERFRRRDAQHLDIEVTIDDPKTFSHSFTVTEHARLLPDTDLTEWICLEEHGINVRLGAER